MSLESFYGGRQGASFVIVKHFDGIDIPQPNRYGNYTYTGNYYAVDTVGRIILQSGGKPISKNSENQNLYTWEYFQHNGNVNISTNDGGVYSFDTELAEGMVQCFEQGVSSTSEVNYGEYVIIDTIARMKNKNDVDNGKVYRRGMNFQNELGGAEYIGQIVGPQGETPEVDVVSYDDILSILLHKEGSYVPDKDVIPGRYVDEDGEEHFVDEIKYAYGTMRDAAGNIIGCEIGFKVPTLIQDFVGYSISPYEGRIEGTSGFNSQYVNLIYEDPSEYINQKWKHPFYQKWQVKIPQGYHGVNSTDIEIIPTETKPASAIWGEEYTGATVYADPDLTEEIGVSENALIIMRGEKYNSDPEVPYAVVIYNDKECYVKKEDCYKYVMRYKETNFDDVEEGTVRYIEIGDYNSIEKITLSENGILTAFYASRGPEALDHAIRWIEHEHTKGIEIDDDGTVHIYFNTLDSDGNYEHYDYPTVLDWVQSVTLSQDGKFKVVYNNSDKEDLPIDPVSGNSMYQSILNWIDYVDITDDGIVNFYYNSDHKNPAYSSSTVNRIKYIKDISFDSAVDGGLEGSGSQKFTFTYNTRDAFGNNEVEDNSDWAAINYVIEAKVYVPIVGFGDSSLAYHLIAIFSDPEYRKKFSTHFKYPSDKLGVVYDEWVDLGYVRGEKGGFHTIAQLEDSRRLVDDRGVAIPPEAIKYAEEHRNNGERYVYDGATGIDLQQAGWGVLVKESNLDVLYFYDYSESKWYRGGEIDLTVISPDKIIMQGSGDANMLPAGSDDLIKGGFWFETEHMTCVV